METMKHRTVIYEFKHSKMGFQNEVTVDSLNEEHAIENAKQEVAKIFGKGMLQRFIFKVKTTTNEKKKSD
jgi:hypothetical protein